MNEMIKKEAEFYLINNYTVEETASRLHICKSTLQKHFQKLASTNPELYNQVRNKQMMSMQLGRKKGGKTGKRTKSYTVEDAIKIANIFINNEYTLDELSKVTGMPRTTLDEMLRSDVFDKETRSQIELTFQANIKKRASFLLQERLEARQGKGIGW